MTIVLQNQFWDLEIEDERFCVTLSFHDIRERLSIPFASIIAFADPSVRFGLQFEAENSAQADSNPPEAAQVRAGPMLVEVGKEEDSESAEESEEPEEADEEAPAKKDGDGEKANVVTLDTFRKK